MKREHYHLLLLLLSVLFIPAYASAQVQVTGKVTDAATGDPLPGVAVTVEGTTIGTQTDLDGNYEINVPSAGAVLEFSFLGYSTQTAAADNQLLNIQMEASAEALNEVVVTALGIERQRNELPYAAQEIQNDELTRTRSSDFVTSLSGKIAGLNVNSTNSLGGSTNVVVRGYKSITGNNQALFVIDGVPVSNANTNTSNQMTGRGGYDYGNAAADINPDNIKSVTVLKGAAATALYGSRAANGVIMITTKKGRENSLDIVVNTGLKVGSIDPSTFVKYQKEYGAGYSSGFYSYDILGNGQEEPVVQFSADASFGSKFDPNLMVYHWDAFDPASPNYLKKRPWVAADNGPEAFYQNSLDANQNITITGGGERTTFKAAYTRADIKGVLPNSKIDKNLFNFSASFDVTEKLTVSAAANYSRISGLGRYGTGYDSRNPNQQFRQWFQTNVDLVEQKEAYFRNEQNITWNWNNDTAPIFDSPIYSDNPYWTRYQNYQDDSRDHYYGYASINWEVADWLNVMGRIAFDGTDEIQEERIAVGSVDVPEYARFNRTFSETNFDLMLNFNKAISEDISFTGLLGSNLRRTRLSSIDASTNGGLVVPHLYALSNSVSPIEPPVERYERVGVDGIFASATFGFREFLFLDLTGRRDQSTTLPEGNNIYYYPSVAGSFLFSNVIKDLPWLSYGKLRVNYAEVGNDAPALSLFDVYDKPVGFGDVPVFSLPDTKNNEDLKPERTRSVEAGIEAAFADNRVGFDLTLYKSNTMDAILPVSVSQATGYSSLYVNSGEVENKGIEVSAFVTPVRSADFTWTMDFNFSRNVNKVLSLYAETDNVPLGSFQGGVTANAAKGQPFGVLRGTDFLYHENGQPIVNEDGYYMTTGPTSIIGNPNPDWLGGINNSFRYKDLTLDFLVDIRQGGDIFSLDLWYGMGTGMYPETAGLNKRGKPKRDPVDEGGGVLLPGVQEDGTPNEVWAENINGNVSPFGYAMNAPRAQYVYDGSYVKLREVALTWSLPQQWIQSTRVLKGIDVSLIGRNLWIIDKNLLYSDPETQLSSGNINGYQSGAYPAVRTYGFNVKFRF